MLKDFFKHKAEGYEQDDRRVENVATIAASVLRHTDLKPDMELMDFGSGTGLLLENIIVSSRGAAETTKARSDDSP